MTDVQRCVATARLFGITRPTVVHGAQHVVLMEGDRVLRFPRHDADAARIEEIAERHSTACALGLARLPPVRVMSGPVGTAHLELVRIDGIPLPHALAAGDADLDLVAQSLVEALAATRRVTAQQWRFDQQSWVDLWADLPRRAHAHSNLLPAAELPSWVAAAEQAAAVAAAAPLGLMHGDLQGHNVLVGADGRVTAVLDWDSALIGDPAMDTAAALYDFPTAVRERCAARHDWLRADVDRFDAYRATWELQAALWHAGERPVPALNAVTRHPQAGTGR